MSVNEYDTAGETDPGGGSRRMDVFCPHALFSPLLLFPTFIEKKQKQPKQVAGSSGPIFFKSFN